MLAAMIDERLARILARPQATVVGLNSGTSMDAIDAAMVDIEHRREAPPRLAVRAFVAHPYPADLRRRLLEAPELDLRETCRLHVAVGEAFAEAARAVAARAGIGLQEVDLIGSHGQTVCHLPDRQAQTRAATLQIGDLDVIAERTGVITVGDFRMRDVAAGGEGAPLMPLLDWILFQDRPRTLCLNLGGVANLTFVTSEPESVVACDVGPANLPLDILAGLISNGKESYDPGGRMAESGTVDRVLLERLLAHPFLAQPPPKTTGREMFGRAFVQELIERSPHLQLRDLLATTSAFVAHAVHRGAAEHLCPGGTPRELVVSGGGVHNLTVLRLLKQLFFPVPVTSMADHGVDPDAKEALLFAVLAWERLRGGAGNLPQVTGARWPVRLGKIAL
jgi:anhydro-N-acetylmuramic acid kinase